MSALECTDYDKLKEELIGLGLYEDGMNVDDMVDLMAAIRNSEDSALKEERLRESNKKVQASISAEPAVREVKRGMERRYKNVPERRLPWNLFPFPEKLSIEQKSRILATYKEQLTLCQYRKARSSSVFAEWNCVFKLPLQPPMEYTSLSLHHTRSGRTVRCPPQYIEDDSDTETVSVSRKPRKKMRKLTNDEIIAKSSLFKDTTHVDNNLETDKHSNKWGNSKLVNNESMEIVAKSNTGSDEEKNVKKVGSPAYISSPEYGNDVIICNEESRGTARKRPRIEKENSIE